MKKIAVIYSSKHGAAKQYAEWIAQDTGADLFSADGLKPRDVADYDILVYGGGIYSGGIRNLDFIRKNIRKKFDGKEILCFGVGITIDNAANREQADDINFTKQMADVPHWYFPGAFDPAKQKGLDRRIVAWVRKMIDDGDANSFGATLAGYFNHGCDLVDRNRIKPMVERIRALSA
ncbi:flavodoxin domain-containing protein [Eubacterium pyruvativorans]|uniref:flavodoxin domain-containing protein n=1 Tax=Eubacterium pyruvativorans TaxID=155865 RepID=UPI0015686E3D|nr:flavodoxin domain-containing protein [Eubacterium pyruvativorans]